MGINRRWTEEEKQYLMDNWGVVSIKHISKKLNRSVNAINVKVYRWGLGPFLESGGYITWNQLLKALGICGGRGYKEKSWVKNRGFPLKTQIRGKMRVKIVYIEDFWKWAEQYKSFLDFSKFEENILGKEPDWVKKKRKEDFEKSLNIKATPWEAVEDERLIKLLREHRYSYQDLSKRLNRTNGAIQRRINELGLKERPIKEEVRFWTDSEVEMLVEMVRNGNNYLTITKNIGRSEKAIRGYLGRVYGTENLDRLRMKLSCDKANEAIAERL